MESLSKTTDLDKRRFVLGMLLGWAPLIPMLPGLVNALREFGNQKQTGLGAVAGGFSEYLVVFGLGAVFACLGIAIVQLMRTFSKGHWVRNMFAALTIAWSSLLLAVFSLFVWVTLFLHR